MIEILVFSQKAYTDIDTVYTQLQLWISNGVSFYLLVPITTSRVSRYRYQRLKTPITNDDEN